LLSEMAPYESASIVQNRSVGGRTLKEEGGIWMPQSSPARNGTDGRDESRSQTVKKRKPPREPWMKARIPTDDQY
jgi:hypothetical protein